MIWDKLILISSYQKNGVEKWDLSPTEMEFNNLIIEIFDIKMCEVMNCLNLKCKVCYVKYNCKSKLAMFDQM